MRKAISSCLAADGGQGSKSSSVITQSQGVIHDTVKGNQNQLQKVGPDYARHLCLETSLCAMAATKV